MKPYQFAEHLEKHGPSSGESVIATDEAFRYCRDLAKSHYENFSVTNCFLPRELRQHFANVYAFCRWSDDLADEVQQTDESLELLRWWRGLLYAAYDRNSGQLDSASPEPNLSKTHPVFVALQVTIKQYHIPMEPFENLIDAFVQDQTKTRYADFDELHRYCAKSANPVGRIVLALGRSSTPQNIQLSDNICTGLQLANFLQDIREDLERDRIYIPSDTRQRFHYSEQDFLAQVYNDPFREMMTYEVNRAERFFYQGSELIERVDRAISPSVQLFVRGGLKALNAIRRAEYNVWSKNARLKKWEKIMLLLQTWLPGSGRSLSRKEFSQTPTNQRVRSAE